MDRRISALLFMLMCCSLAALEATCQRKLVLVPQGTPPSDWTAVPAAEPQIAVPYFPGSVTFRAVIWNECFYDTQPEGYTTLSAVMTEYRWKVNGTTVTSGLQFAGEQGLFDEFTVGISPIGTNTVSCDVRYSIDLFDSNFNIVSMYTEWFSVGSTSIFFSSGQSLNSLACQGTVSSTASPGLSETVAVAVGGTVTVQARDGNGSPLLYNSVTWSCSGGNLTPNGSAAIVDVSTPGPKTVTASSGGVTVSIIVLAVGVSGFAAAIVDENENLLTFWNQDGSYGSPADVLPASQFMTSGGDSFLSLMAQDMWLTVLACPAPALADTVAGAEARLPSAWSFTGGTAVTTQMVRKLDLSQTGTTVFEAQCGSSAKSLTVVVGRLDLRADSNGDGSITSADDAVEMSSPGVVCIADDGDADSDEIMDHSDLQIGTQNGTVPQLFTERQVELAYFLCNGDIRIQFQYSAAPAVGSQGQGGTARLWKKQSNQLRNALPVKDGGDFIVPDSAQDSSGYTPMQLGLTVTTLPVPDTQFIIATVTGSVWLEATDAFQDGVVCAFATGSGSATAEDEVKASAVSLQTGLTEAAFTGGGTVPQATKTTFGLPLVVNNDHDGDSSETPNTPYARDCDDSIINNTDDLDDMGLITFPALPSFMPATGTVQLSFQGGTVRLFETDSLHSCAGVNGVGMTPSQLYSRLRQGSLS